MKKISKIISVMLVFAMLFQAPCAFASVKTKSKYTGITYTHASRFDDKDLTVWIFHTITEKSILKR